MLKLPYKLVK